MVEIGVFSGHKFGTIAANRLDAEPNAQMVEATEDLSHRVQGLVDFAPILDQDLALLESSEHSVDLKRA